MSEAEELEVYLPGNGKRYDWLLSRNRDQKTNKKCMIKQIWKTDVWKNKYLSFGHSAFAMPITHTYGYVHWELQYLLMHSFSKCFWVFIVSKFYFTWCLNYHKEKLWPDNLIAVLATCSAWRRDTKPQPEIYSQECGHKSFNRNVASKYILNYKMVAAQSFLTLF